MSLVPDWPMPADFAVIPLDQLAGTAEVFAAYLTGDSAPALSRAERAADALYGIAAATCAIERICARRAALIREALAAGAGPVEVSARITADQLAPRQLDRAGGEPR